MTFSDLDNCLKYFMKLVRTYIGRWTGRWTTVVNGAIKLIIASDRLRYDHS